MLNAHDGGVCSIVAGIEGGEGGGGPGGDRAHVAFAEIESGTDGGEQAGSQSMVVSGVVGCEAAWELRDCALVADVGGAKAKQEDVAVGVAFLVVDLDDDEVGVGGVGQGDGLRDAHRGDGVGLGAEPALATQVGG